MKAAQFFGKGDIRVVDVPRPDPKDNEVLIDIEWCGICGSDLHEYIQGWYTPAFIELSTDLFRSHDRSAQGTATSYNKGVSSGYYGSRVLWSGQQSP
jgi:NADPH:quinone reductase-like Zn-dependent oxidoreductase